MDLTDRIGDWGRVNDLGISDIKINSAFHPFGVGKLSSRLYGY